MVAIHFEFLSCYFYSLHAYNGIFYIWQLVFAPGEIQAQVHLFVPQIAALVLKPASEVMVQVRQIVQPAAEQFILACAAVMVVKKILGW